MNRSQDNQLAADPIAALRAATSGRHELLDSGLPIGADDAALHDYATHLALLRAWLVPLHAWLAGFEDGPDFDQAARLALIDADLAGPGMAGVDAAALAPPPHADAVWPADAGLAYRWGVRYVIEGSSLGGAVLYQRLHVRLAPHPLLYLKGSDAGPGPRWRALMQALRAQVRTPEQIADCCAGACAAFDAIRALR